MKHSSEQKLNFKHTLLAGYVGYMTQALAINFSPLLFTTFCNDYGISLGKIGVLIATSFITQLTVDSLAAKFSHKLNTRLTVVLGQLSVTVGMILFSFLPDLMPDPFAGLAVCTVLTAVGGGIIEVMISPIVEACPTEEKSSSMSILHSFYSWGSVATILMSTLFFLFFGTENRRILSVLWALLPLFGAILFAIVPIYELDEADGRDAEDKKKRKSKQAGIFFMLLLIIFASGAAELAMSQWASAFAEKGLGIEKMLGDILGPCLFALFMGISRVTYAFLNKIINLQGFFVISALLCIMSYLIAALSPLPLLSLIGCAVCGMSVGIMWPGTYSLAGECINGGGVRMFALLAIAGDLGCTVGPSAVGFLAELCGDDLKIPFLLSSLFPLLILILLIPVCRYIKRHKSEKERDMLAEVEHGA